MGLLQSSKGAFNSSFDELMVDVRQPVFVDNAVHYAKSNPQSSVKTKILIENRNAQNYEVASEKTYAITNSESTLIITHTETDGHTLKSDLWSSEGKNKPTALMYSDKNTSLRLLGSTYENTNKGLRMNLRNMQNRSFNEIGFEGDNIHFGQIIDVGLRTTDLCLRLADDITGSVTAVSIGNSMSVNNSSGNRRKNSNTYLAANFNNVNLITALQYVSRHDNRISTFDKNGVLQYVPFNFTSKRRFIQPNFRFGSSETNPVENLENRITVKGVPIALNEDLLITMDDGERQQGKFDTDILENTSPIFDASIKNKQDARKIARQILKANALMKGAIDTKGHPDAWDIRPGDLIEYGTNTYVVMEAQHKLSDRLSNFKFLALDTGIEGVLRGVLSGSIVSSSKDSSEKTGQILENNLSFFNSLDIMVTPLVTVRQVSPNGLLIGENTGRKSIGGAASINTGSTTHTITSLGLNKSDNLILRGDA